MGPFVIQHVGVYTRVERGHYITPCPSFGLTLSGLKWIDCVGRRVEFSGPFFMLAPGRTPVDFEYGPDRRNYAILVEGDFIRASRLPGYVELRQDQDWVRVPAYVPVPLERLPGLEAECLAMTEAFLSPTPANRLRVELGFCNLLRSVLDQHADEVGVSPAAVLKRLMDRDPLHQRSIRALAHATGVSCDHARVLFTRAYGVSPKQYRARMRLALAMDLMAKSPLSLKEIADRTGFRHASHFSAVYREALGYTPREGINRFRH